MSATAVFSYRSRRMEAPVQIESITNWKCRAFSSEARTWIAGWKPVRVKKTRQTKEIEPQSPRVAHDALAGVGAGDVGKFAFEGGGGGPAVQPFHFSGCRGQRRIMRLRRAVDDEACARQRLEGGGDIAIGVEIMRPCQAAAQ